MLLPPRCNQSCVNHRSASMLKSLEEHRPWTQAAGATLESAKYVAWHIRTSDGESPSSFEPEVHQHVFDRVPSTEVCPWFFTAMQNPIGKCRDGSTGDAMPIFVSSNRSVYKWLSEVIASAMIFARRGSFLAPDTGVIGIHSHRNDKAYCSTVM